MSLLVLWSLLTQAKNPKQSDKLSGVTLVYKITVETFELMARDSYQCVHWVCSVLVVWCKAYPRTSGYGCGDCICTHTHTPWPV